MENQAATIQSIRTDIMQTRDKVHSLSAAMYQSDAQDLYRAILQAEDLLSDLQHALGTDTSRAQARAYDEYDQTRRAHNLEPNILI